MTRRRVSDAMKNDPRISFRRYATGIRTVPLSIPALKDRAQITSTLRVATEMMDDKDPDKSDRVMAPRLKMKSLK